MLPRATREVEMITLFCPLIFQLAGISQGKRHVGAFPVDQKPVSSRDTFTKSEQGCC